ncbi:MAG: thioredoxin domain-containing protein [Deltaproteobacteria bacterium]|nr:thioredoxin domain-containing protein [Deltaproteobacteria bacterium]
MRIQTWMLCGVLALTACTASKKNGSSSSVTELSPSDQNVVAMIGAEKITEEEFIANMDSQIKGEFSRAQQEYRAAKEAALSEMIFEKVLNKEAEKQGISKNELIEKEIGAKIDKVSDQDVQAYYDEVSKRFAAAGKTAPELNDMVKMQIRMSLEAEKSAMRELAYSKELFEKYNVAFVLPEPIRFQIDKGNLPHQGGEGAKVTVIEFSDYHCPYCKRGADNMKQIVKKYGNKIEYRFRDYPLEQIHPRAKAASQAARCANEQGKFWKYHDKVFENQDKREDADFIAFAKDLKMDVDKFTTCYNDKKYNADVEKDLAEGQKSGVSGTPAYFINGVFVSGALPPEKLSEIIDKEL